MIRPFLSYAHEDRLQVRELYDKLKAAGFDPWLDHEHLRGGQTWELEIKGQSRAAISLLPAFRRSRLTREDSFRKS